VFYKGQGRLNKDQKIMNLDIDALLGLTKYETFILKYDIPLEQQFNIDDSLKALMDSKWVFINADGIGHTKIMTLQVHKKCPNKDVEKEISIIITKAIIKGKRFFDFVYTLDIKLTTKADFGIIFRQVDGFNYYAASITEDELKIIKIKDGKDEVLGTLLLKTKIMHDAWYNVKLIAI